MQKGGGVAGGADRYYASTEAASALPHPRGEDTHQRAEGRHEHRQL